MQPLKPSIFVIFGITGDLAQRKLLPAIYHLFKDGLVHEESVILGISRREVTTQQLLEQVELCVNEIDNVCDPVALAKVQDGLRMHQMSQTEGSEYDELLQILNDIESQQGVCMDRLYYLSIPPQMFEPIVRNLGQHGHNQSCAHGTASTRLLIEKPFGFDTVSAQDLIDETGEWFTEDQTFRIDHYVAKNAVVDLLQFRREHPELAEIWNNQHIRSVDITAIEQLDIEGRAVFYDSIGALRDIIQSHLLQVMAVALMDIPAGDAATDLHASRLKLLQDVDSITTDTVQSAAVRAQYDGYADEIGRSDSSTETYAELTLNISTDTWNGVPVRLRTGKALAQKSTEIRFKFTDGTELICHIQPDTGLELVVDGRVEPDASTALLQAAVAAFNAAAAVAGRPHYPDAYERVLVEASAGSHDVFTTSLEILAAWKIVENVIQKWSQDGDGLIHYSKGTSQVVG